MPCDVFRVVVNLVLIGWKQQLVLSALHTFKGIFVVVLTALTTTTTTESFILSLNHKIHMSPRPNWDPHPPHQQASVSPPEPKGGHTRLRVRGGVPIQTTGTKPSTLLRYFTAPYCGTFTLYSTTVSCAATFWATLYPTELWWTLLRHTAPHWALLHRSELRCTLLSYAAPYWATIHIAELLCAPRSTMHPDELFFATRLSCAASNWAKLRPVLSYAAPYIGTAPCWATWQSKFSILPQ